MQTKVSRLKKKALKFVLPWVNNCGGENEKERHSRQNTLRLMTELEHISAKLLMV